MSRRIAITGVAGFIGMSLAKSCLSKDCSVLGIDSLNSYYDVALKEARLKQIEHYSSFQFIQEDVVNRHLLVDQLTDFGADAIVHLAAQPGIRHSFTHPEDYIHNNILGTYHVLEMAKECNIQRLLYASSSSVYGGITDVPYHTDQKIDKPLNLYAASKASAELIAHSYAHLYGMDVAGLRFFTVYGPWGRPDMAIYQFTRALYEGTPITLYNKGDMWRDFTYIDDIVASMEGLLQLPLMASRAAVYNIGSRSPISVLQLIELLETLTGKKAIRQDAEFQAGEMYKTYADVSTLEKDIDFIPETPIEQGLERFVNWYRDYHGV